jgi:hypothetical protein
MELLAGCSFVAPSDLHYKSRTVAERSSYTHQRPNGRCQQSETFCIKDIVVSSVFEPPDE